MTSESQDLIQSRDATPVLCRDCRWATETRERPAFWKCISPNNRIKNKIDPVSGEATETRTFIYCATLRDLASEQSCGPDGDWWEAAEQKEAAE